MGVPPSRLPPRLEIPPCPTRIPKCDGRATANGLPSALPNASPPACAVKARARDARLRAAGQPRRNRERARAYERERARRQTVERTARGVCTKYGGNPTEPGRRLCGPCAEKRREYDHDRYENAKAAGLLYGGKNIKSKRRRARVANRKHREARRESDRCLRCGCRPPVEDGVTCGPCCEIRQAAKRVLYATRRASGLCTRCG